MLLRRIKPLFSWTLVAKKGFQTFSNDSVNQKIVMKSFQEGNAQLAYGLINLISSKSTLQEIQTYSLNQRILNFIQSQPNIRDDSKKQISSLFTSGVNIDNDKKVFTQGRIADGLTKINKQQMFVFYPTYLVTSQIFQKIMELKDKKRILTGHMGISKTVSVFLFWKLTQYIDKFRFNSDSEISEKYLSIPKIFYWTIIPEDTLKTVKQKLLKQTDSQYLKKNKNKLKNLKNYYGQYHKMKFSQQPVVIMICDQSNWLDKYTRIVQFLSKKQIKSKQQKSQLKEAKKFLERMNKIFKVIFPEFEGILYLSSMQIDDLIAKSFNLSRELTHGKVKKQLVLYSSEIFKDQNMYALCDYFIKQFEQRVLRQNNLSLTESIIKDLRKKCFDQLKNTLGMYFFTPRGLSNLIEVRKDHIYRQLQNLKTQQQKINYIADLFNNLVNSETEQYGNVLNQNFLKNDSNDQYRLDMHFKLYSYLTQKNKNLKKQQQLNAHMVKIEELGSWSSESLNKYLDKRLFYYQLKDVEIKLQLPIKLTLKILEKKIADHVKIYLQKHSKIFQYVNDKAQMGKIVQRFFFYALLTGKTDFQFILPSKNPVSFQNISATQFWFQSLPIFNRPNKDQKSSQQISEQNPAKIQKTSIKVDNLEKKQISNNFSQQLKQQTKNDNEKKINKNVGQLSQEQKNYFIQLSLKKKLKQLQEDTQTRRGNQYQFLKSFEQKIKEIYKTNQSISLLCLPANLKSKQIPKRTSLFLKQKLDKINKCVDGVLLNYIKSNEEPQVQLWAFDLTVGEERVKKLKKFIKQFIGFKDRAIKYIKVGSQNETTKNIKIFLNYYAIDYKESKQDLQSQLNQQFGEFIEFKKNPYCSEYEVVSLKGSDQCLLRRVGFLNYHENIKFINPTQNNALVFQQALQACQRLDSRNAKEKRN